MSDYSRFQKGEVNELREALARVEAERGQLRECLSLAAGDRDTAQAQLAEAVGLLEKVTDTTGWDHRDGPLLGLVHDFLVPHREAAFMKQKGARHAQVDRDDA